MLEHLGPQHNAREIEPINEINNLRIVKCEDMFEKGERLVLSALDNTTGARISKVLHVSIGPICGTN